MKFDIDRTEYLTMNVLKDFQRATVERIDALFRKGQGRILVADEVGMGKTLIARGAIVKTARLRLEEGEREVLLPQLCRREVLHGCDLGRREVEAHGI